LGKFNLSSSSPFLRSLDKNRQSAKGFTLIELLIVIVVLAVLTTILLVTLNPLTQIQKGQDAQRQQDLRQIGSALDTYYNDNNCYPKSIPSSGTSWTSADGKTVYMKKVPGDPTVAGGGRNYAYLTDGTDCPQWDVLLAKVSNTSDYNKNPNAQEKATLCPLTNMGTPCIPNNFAKYNYCVLSGTVNCNIVGTLSAASLDNTPIAPFVTPTNSPVIQPTDTPFPTPTLGPITPCSCANTIAHAYAGQSCQGGGWSDSGFDHSVYNFYCHGIGHFPCPGDPINGCCAGLDNPAATCP
jgi:general secretion pathway protein G